MDLVPGDMISDAIRLLGVYEPEVSELLLERARTGGRLVQVGANLGYFSLLWAAACPANEVFAFEASARNVEWLWRNVRQNGLQHRIHVLPVAAGRATALACFDDGPPDQTGWGGFSPAPAPTSSRVVVVRLDEVLADEPIDTLLIDTEGADTWVLFGCEQLLRGRRIALILYEQNPRRMRALGIQPGEAARFLTEVGYAPTLMYGDSDTIEEWCARPLT
jgi:FkbM family methyltransferase